MLTELCAHCGGTIRYVPVGKRVDRHTRRDCPGRPPPLQPEKYARVRDSLDDLAALRKAFRGLKSDLHEAGDNLGAPSRRDWPPRSSVIVQELTIGDQLDLLCIRAMSLIVHGCPAARPLLGRVRAFLESASAQTGFTAPTPTQPPEHAVAPPKAVQGAIERLRYTRAPGDALLSKHPPRDSNLARDWRLATWWLSTLEQP